MGLKNGLKMAPLCDATSVNTQKNVVLQENKTILCQDYEMTFIDPKGKTISAQKLDSSNANPYNLVINNKAIKATYPNQINSKIAFNGATFSQDTNEGDITGIVFRKVSPDGMNHMVVLARKLNVEVILIKYTSFVVGGPHIMQFLGRCN